MTYTEHDSAFMRHALTLAKRHTGLTLDNPSVGCVIVADNNIIVGRGVTAIGGRPHAETIALEQAGSKAKNSVVYVTLEPCSHYGKTPPCVYALIDAGVKKILIVKTYEATVHYRHPDGTMEYLGKITLDSMILGLLGG